MAKEITRIPEAPRNADLAFDRPWRQTKIDTEVIRNGSGIPTEFVDWSVDQSNAKPPLGRLTNLLMRLTHEELAALAELGGIVAPGFTKEAYVTLLIEQDVPEEYVRLILSKPRG